MRKTKRGKNCLESCVMVDNMSVRYEIKDMEEWESVNADLAFADPPLELNLMEQVDIIVEGRKKSLEDMLSGERKTIRKT